LSMAFSPPRSRSSTITSGSPHVAAAKASALVAASPTTSRSGWPSRSKRSPMRMTMWSSTRRTWMGDGGCGGMAWLRLQGDVDHDYRAVVCRLLDTRAASQGGGTCRDRARHEGGRHGPRGDSVGGPEIERAVGAGEAEGDLSAARVPSHITQPF